MFTCIWCDGNSFFSPVLLYVCLRLKKKEGVVRYWLVLQYIQTPGNWFNNLLYSLFGLSILRLFKKEKKLKKFRTILIYLSGK